MIRFVIKPGGAVSIQPTGYPGAMCHQATKSYEDKLEGKQTTQEVEDQTTVVQNQNEVRTQQ